MHLRFSRARSATASPLAPRLAAMAWRTVAIVLALGGAAGLVRVLPLLLAPSVPFRAALPFARSVAWLALEAATLVGGPLGWALGAYAFGERGEARVLAMLGEPPARTTARLVPHALLFVLPLFGLSMMAARDTTRPGETLSQLLAQSRAACDGADARGRAEPAERGGTNDGAMAVPLLGVTWLCADAAGAADATGRGGAAPVLVGKPSTLAGHAVTSGPASAPGRVETVFTASAVRVSPRLDALELDDARLDFGPLRAHVAHVELRNVPGFPSPSKVTPASHALGAALGALGASLLVVLLLLVDAARPVRVVWNRGAALALGVAGPLATSLVLRALDRAAASRLTASASLVAPVAALATVTLVWLVLRSLRARRRSVAPAEG